MEHESCQIRAIWTAIPEHQPECCLLLRRFLRYRPAVAPVYHRNCDEQNKANDWSYGGNSHAEECEYRRNSRSNCNVTNSNPLHVYAEPLGDCVPPRDR